MAPLTLNNQKHSPSFASSGKNSSLINQDLPAYFSTVYQPKLAFKPVMVKTCHNNKRGPFSQSSSCVQKKSTME